MLGGKRGGHGSTAIAKTAVWSALHHALPPMQCSLGILTDGSTMPHCGMNAPSAAAEVSRVASAARAYCMRSKVRLRTVQYHLSSGQHAERDKRSVRHSPKQFTLRIAPRIGHCQVVEACVLSTVV